MASTPESSAKPTKSSGAPTEPAKATTPRIFAGNLSWNTSKESLRAYMETAGTVTRCDILLDHLGRSKVWKAVFQVSNFSLPFLARLVPRMVT